MVKNSFSNAIRRLAEYSEWRLSILERDSHKCLRCQSKEELHVDHIVSLRTLIKKFLSECNQFSPIEDKETLIRLVRKWKPFWEIENGRTLCFTCHTDR